MDKLSKNKCEACNELTPKLTTQEIAILLKQVPDWEIIDAKKIVKKWKFKNFTGALRMVNTIGALAEEENHHPDIRFGWGYLEITLSTHAINGLSKNDFILAAKINEIPTIIID